MLVYCNKIGRTYDTELEFQRMLKVAWPQTVLTVALPTTKNPLPANQTNVKEQIVIKNEYV